MRLLNVLGELLREIILHEQILDSETGCFSVRPQARTLSNAGHILRND